MTQLLEFYHISPNETIWPNPYFYFRTQLIWRIDEFGRKMKEAKNGNTPTLFSPPFYTSRHGYRLAASLCLNGDGKGKGTHISAFISILKGNFHNRTSCSVFFLYFS